MRGRAVGRAARRLERVVAVFTNLAPLGLQACHRYCRGLPKRWEEASSPSSGCPPVISAKSWVEISDLHREARDHGVEGLVLKRTNSAYGVGCLRGDWWKWKVDPYVIDAILVAAQRGHGRRASLYTDYTFAVWSNGQLTPVAKAYSGLTDEEIMRSGFVCPPKHDRETSARCASLAPLQVFELAFEGIQKSARHKSGVAVRFPASAAGVTTNTRKKPTPWKLCWPWPPSAEPGCLR